MSEEETSTLTTFTSISIILLTMFLYLNSVAVPSSARSLEVMQSVEKQFPTTKIQEVPKTKKLSLTEKFPDLLTLAKDLGLKVSEKNPSQLVINFPGPNVFLSGSDQIRASMLSRLESIAKATKNPALYLTIQAEVQDSAPRNGEFETSWDLAIARAVSVFRFFLDRGIAFENLKATSTGQVHGKRGKDQLLIIIHEAQNQSIYLDTKAQPDDEKEK